MSNFATRAAIAYLSAVLLGGTAAAQDKPPAPDGISVYTNAEYHWSIAYPATWTLDADDATFIRIVAPENNGVCGIRSRGTSKQTAEALADYAMAYAKKNIKKHKGLEQVTVNRESKTLRGNLPGVEVFVDIRPDGGQARRIYAVANGNGFMVDCAASNASWRSNDPQFKKIIASFTVSK